MTAMTPDELRAAIAALGLTQTGQHGLDRFLEVSERRVRRWIAGDPIPVGVAILLRMMVARKMNPQTIKEAYYGLARPIAVPHPGGDHPPRKR